MSITFTTGVWVANFDFDNKHIPKAAGFLWHPEVGGPRCRPNCKACKAGLVKKWWTPYPEKAAVLIEHCDDAAKQALTPHLTKTESSKATDSDLDLAKPDGLEYLPYQKAGIAYALGRKGTLFADEMGLGKTIQALGVINNDASVDTILVLCPASLRLNWERECNRWLTTKREAFVVDSPKAVPADAKLVICNYDRLKDDVLRSLMRREWDCLIADECFPAGTEVDTPCGPRPIESLKAGDTVLGATGPQKIRKAKKTYTDSLVRINFKNGKSLICTPNHPFFTNKGWEFACNLSQSHYIMSQAEAKDLTDGNVRVVRETLSPEDKANEVLRDILRSEMENEPAKDQEKDIYPRMEIKNLHCTDTSPQGRSFIGKAIISKNDETQPDEISCDSKESIGDAESDESQTSSAWRKWYWSDAGRKATAHLEGLSAQLPNTDKREERIRISNQLQSGYSVSRDQISSGSGRTEPRLPVSEKAGSKERKETSGAWVDSVEILQQRDIEQLGNGKSTVAVYNLEVEHHPSYSVKGLLVHNCHYLKNPDAKRTKVVFGISAKWKKNGNDWIQDKPRVDGLVDRVSHRLMLLTGTPILNRPIELFPMLQALDPKTWKSSFQFAKTYCNAHHNGYGYDYSGANKARLGELQERLRSTVMVRRLKKDVLKELPAKRRQVVVLPLNGASAAVEAEEAAWKAHQEHIEELEQTANLAHAAGDQAAYKAAVDALNQGIRHAFTEIAAARKAVALAKVEKVVEHIENMLESGIEKVLVWAHHHEVTDKLVASLNAMRADGRDSLEDRQAAVDAFQNDPSKRIMVCGIHAMGEGHTMTAASNEVFAELDWVPAKMSQCEDRCHRIGQTESVLVQHLVLDRSLDCTMAQVLVEKQDIADRGLDAPTSLSVSVVPSKKGNRPASYPVPTEEERKHAAGAVQLLAAMCDGASSEDHMGFSKLDTHAGKQLAARSMHRPMTDGEVFFAKKLARKYRRQLGEKFWEVLGLGAQ